jgi:hypothetical protein
MKFLSTLRSMLEQESAKPDHIRPAPSDFALKPWDVLACPVHKSGLRFSIGEGAGARIRRAELFCDQCSSVVGRIAHGKADFIRIADREATRLSPASAVCRSFAHQRIPYKHEAVSASGFTEKNLGWNAEGFRGCLYADGSVPWSLSFTTDAIDLDLRALCHAWSGMVDVFVGGRFLKTLDLYDPTCNEFKSHPLFVENGARTVVEIKPSRSTNPGSHGTQFFFSGFDASLPASETRVSVQQNRGNHYPAMYAWVMQRLGPDARVLDCGSGDRTYGDARVLGFEYLPFELPEVFGDGHTLPFIDSSFDVVFSQAVFEHMRDPFLGAREILRILKPGGLVYVESAFMQPLHAVPYHFFNTTPWGIETLFTAAGAETMDIEWFGSLSSSVNWYLDACNARFSLPPEESDRLSQILTGVDSRISYEALKSVAGSVAYWGIKYGTRSPWRDALSASDRPTFKY